MTSKNELFDRLLARAEARREKSPGPVPESIRAQREAFQQMLIGDSVTARCHFSLLHKTGSSAPKRSRAQAKIPNAKRMKQPIQLATLPTVPELLDDSAHVPYQHAFEEVVDSALRERIEETRTYALRSPSITVSPSQANTSTTHHVLPPSQLQTDICTDIMSKSQKPVHCNSMARDNAGRSLSAISLAQTHDSILPNSSPNSSNSCCQGSDRTDPICEVKFHHVRAAPQQYNQLETRRRENSCEILRADSLLDSNSISRFDRSGHSRRPNKTNLSDGQSVPQVSNKHDL